MTQEGKQLLLKDLCGRLPYGLKVKHQAQDFPCTLLWVDSDRLSVGIKSEKCGIGNDWGSIEFIKPYLRPMSSMTEVEKKFVHGPFPFGLWNNPIALIDMLNSCHLDYRGLIEKGLALEAPEGMYKEA